MPDKRKETIQDYLRQEDHWYLNRYLHMSPELKEAYTLKESYKKWQREVKTARDITEVKLGLEAFYREVEFTNSLPREKN